MSHLPIIRDYSDGSAEIQQATTYLRTTLRKALSLLADAQAELATARVTNDRLNRRVQIAESALNELMNGTGKGAPNKIHREAWTRHQEAQAKLNKIVCQYCNELLASIPPDGGKL